MLIYDPMNTNGLPQTPTGMSPAPLRGSSVPTQQQQTDLAKLSQGMPFSQQQLQSIFGAGGSNTVNGGLLSGALTNLGNIPAIQTLGQVATGQQPVPEWIRLAMQSGNMNNPYAPAVPAGLGQATSGASLGSPQSTGGYPMAPLGSPQTLNQASRNPLQASDLRAPDTSMQAYNQAMATTSYGPNGVPTYDQWVQGRNQQFQQVQQYLGGVGQTATPGAGLSPEFLAMTPEQRQALNAAAYPSMDTFAGTPNQQPVTLAQAISNLNKVNPGAINPAIVNPVRPTPAAPVNLSQAIANVRAPQPSWQDRFNALRNRTKFSTNWR